MRCYTISQSTAKGLLAFLLLGKLLVTNAYADNLLEIYQLAQESDPTFLASEAGRMATNESVNQSLASWLPNISASTGYNKSISNTASRLITEPGPLLGQNIPSTTTDTDSYGGINLSLGQKVFDYGNWLQLKQFEKQALQSNINHENVKQELSIRVAEAYFNVLAAQDSVDFSKAESEAVSKQLAQAKQRFEVGLIAMTDVHEAQANYDQALASQIAAQNALDNAYEALQQITGQYHYDLLSLKEDVPLKKPQPADIKSWVKKSEENNLLIKASQISLEIAKRAISIAETGHYPTVDLNASYSRSERSNTLSEVDGQAPFEEKQKAGIFSSRSVGLSINIPIYSGGSVTSQTRQSQHEYQQAAHNLEAERRRAVSSARSAYLGVVASVSSVNAFKQSVVSSQSALDATQAGFEVGTRTIVDVLQQTQRLYDAKRNYAKGRYDYILNTLRLKQAAGLLTNDDLVSINQMLR